MRGAEIRLQPAYLLHTRPYGDTSLLIEAFTPEHGRVGLVARGARGGKRKVPLQILQPLLLSWRSGGELCTLSAYEPQGPAAALVGEPLFCAWYLNELLLRLLQRGDAHPALFGYYATALALLADDAEAALRRFECGLLEELGYALSLPDDLQPEQRYRLHPEQGPLPDALGEVSGAALIGLRDGLWLHAAARSDARRLMRGQLARLLGGKPLETPQLLRALRAQPGQRGP